MKASVFSRELRKIEIQSRGKAAAVRSATRQLVSRNGAAAIIEGHKVIGYRMRDGSVACLKLRYYTAQDGHTEMARIREGANHKYLPVRVYHCPWCDGYHLTSRA
ncbi:hypothetical protein XccvBFoX1_gp47 [Xanthomonas phage FoX1]|uniref:Uncharacterized protein n=1 Tax=Xanthomonas phage FoX1 TaxID=2723897 RepID=A0A858NQ40_9CAUD|nr:hypothetical protein KNU93_gp63 [Xanthomonas phage FoX1]QJB21786.1 hypothetical protein XccvBFoX1_gp47 [Xanthomonas phage FoX1]